MVNRFVPKATWLSDDDMLAIFSIASKLAVLRNDVMNSLMSANGGFTSSAILNQEKATMSKLIAEFAKEKGSDFSSQDDWLFWSIRNSRSNEIEIRVKFDNLGFNIDQPYSVSGLSEAVNGSVLTDKKSRQVICVNWIKNGDSKVTGTYYKNGQKQSFFESMFDS